MTTGRSLLNGPYTHAVKVWHSWGGPLHMVHGLHCTPTRGRVARLYVRISNVDSLLSVKSKTSVPFTVAKQSEPLLEGIEPKRPTCTPVSSTTTNVDRSGSEQKEISRLVTGPDPDRKDWISLSRRAASTALHE
jgi:hypothetical protein